MKKGAEKRVWNGKRIDLLRGAIMGRNRGNEVISAVNALLNSKVEVGDKDYAEHIISDTDSTISIPKSAASSASGGGGATRYRVKTVYGDYLACHTWDGTTEGSTTVNIAKPPELRHSLTSQTIKDIATSDVSVTYSGHFISGGLCKRTASASGYSNQTEVVTPQYQIAGTGADAEIWADEPTGGTGVSVGGTPLTWMDDNRAGRKWCQVS